MCCVKGCRSRINTNPRSHSGRFCRRCRDRRYRISNPISYAWDKLKWSAKHRKISFKLTKDFFKKFCLGTGYADLKGKTAESLSIDRVDSTKGYEPGNIQILTLADNGRKSHVDKKIAAYNSQRSEEVHSMEYEPGEHPFGD
jgi:hypothetical protein